MLEQVLREKDREDRPTRRSKFAKASDAAFKKAIEQFPEDRRTDVYSLQYAKFPSVSIGLRPAPNAILSGLRSAIIVGVAGVVIVATLNPTRTCVLSYDSLRAIEARILQLR